MKPECTGGRSSSERNIVLVGMSGAGKTSVGKALAEMTGRDFVDIDAEIEEHTGMTIPELFREGGEAYFRDLEEEAVRETVKRTHAVISTGGGAVLRPGNICELKKNGIVVFLKRDVETILPDANRPLADTVEKIQKLYKERLPIYEDAADLTVLMEETPQETAKQVLRVAGYCVTGCGEEPEDQTDGRADQELHCRAGGGPGEETI